MQQSMDTFDVVVVGTGPGGATVAREMSLRGRRVLMLEWGDQDPVTGTLAQCFARAFVPGKSLKLTHNLLGMVRGITTGGSSVYYYATAFEPPTEMLAKYGIDIAAEIHEIHRELPVKPLAPHLIGPMAARIMASARDLGYEWRPLPKLVYQERCQPNCWRCVYGCPFGAKWNARMYVNEAVDNGARLITKARASRVLVENNRAVGVAYVRAGTTHHVRAPIVVIAAGGVGSPMILRSSGIQAAGYDWFFDPLVMVMGTVDDVACGREFPMAAGLRMEQEGYVMADMAVPGALHRIFNAQVFRFDKLFSHSKTLAIMIKIKDNLGGYLTKKGGVRKKLAPSDMEKFHQGIARA